MSKFSDIVQDYMEWEKDLHLLKPFRLYKIYPDGNRVAEWDRRRGIRLTDSQKNTMGAGVRLIREMVWPIADMTQPITVYSDKGHAIRIVPRTRKHSEYIRVSFSEYDPNGWMQADFTFEEGGQFSD